MNLSIRSSQADSLHQQATYCFAEGRYEQAAVLYEQLLEQEPEEIHHLWYLGLARLLQGQEAEAQLAWMMAFSDEVDSVQAEQWTTDLIQVLETEATRQTELKNLLLALLIRQHIRELNPSDINNLLHLLTLDSESDQLTGESLQNLGITELLTEGDPESLAESIDSELLLHVITLLLDNDLLTPGLFALVEASSPYITNIPTFVELLCQKSGHAGYILRHYSLACRYSELGLRFDPNHPELMTQLSYFYLFEMKYEEAIALAKRYYTNCCDTLSAKIGGIAYLLRALLRAGGRWNESVQTFETQKLILNEWLNSAADAPLAVAPNIFTSSFFYFPYIADQPRQTRQLQNQVAALCQATLEAELVEAHGADYRQTFFPPRVINRVPKRLKIAYMSCCLRRHSIGWLARWLLQHHDRERFEIHSYFLNQADATPFGQQWYANKSDRAACFSGDPLGIAQTIHENEIDILIDLDSLSLDGACAVTALRAAPVQVSWLGWDASGIPAVDYYMADHYVLPEDAQEYYSETIWRLPQTYLAVDGFEVGIPNIRRDTLNIPNDAVVYFTSQTGQKRNPDNMRLQLRILKNVPGSYLLVKGISDLSAVGKLFEQLAEEEGVSPDRLRYLPATPDEETHRANLGIADIVLDTFPYNGATTTMETLWMGIPLVTQVGNQFAARNSYGMMMNAGITEGIAWTEEEYVEWGVRFGQDAVLRQQIRWRLHQSRQTAPLWNAKQFTGEMEKAYEQMWEIYLQGQ